MTSLAILGLFSFGWRDEGLPATAERTAGREQHAAGIATDLLAAAIKTVAATGLVAEVDAAPAARIATSAASATSGSAASAASGATAATAARSRAAGVGGAKAVAANVLLPNVARQCYSVCVGVLGDSDLWQIACKS